jgi:serine/threonine-protein kinase
VGAIVAGKYRIESILGMGGMGVVAIATHVQLDQKFALKVVHDAMSEDLSIVERFMREARASAKLKSEHVCRVSDVDQLPSGAPFIVMELLEGQDLQKVLMQGVLPIATAADYVLQACIAIAEAHGVGIVHRDLKPANLFLTARMDGSPLIKVLDFGIAKATAEAELKITQTQAIMGSPGYMSPEQLRSARDVDGRSDIWSLGVILYELSSGRLPFIGQTITELAVKVAIDPPAPLPATMDQGFAAIIGRCLEKDIAIRYQTVTELANDLARFAGAAGMHSASLIARLSGSQPGVSAPRSAVFPQATQLTGYAGTNPPIAHAPTAVTPPPKSSKKPLLIGGALFLLAGAAVAGYMLTRDDAKPAKKPAVHRDAGVIIAVADGGSIDAGETFEERQLSGFRAQRRWGEIIDMERNGDPNDQVLKTAVAEARAGYAIDAHTKIDAAVKAGECTKATYLANLAKPYVVDLAPLLAEAKACVEKKSGSGSGSGSAPPPPDKMNGFDVVKLVTTAEQDLKAGDPAGALANAKKVLSDDKHPHIQAARLAAVASCQLHHAADAQTYFDKIPMNAAKVRNHTIDLCRKQGIELR